MKQSNLKYFGILLSFIFISQIVNGQIAKKSFYLGLNMGLNFTQSSTASSSAGNSNATISSPWNTSFYIRPEVGYFVSDKFSIGLGLGIGSYESSVDASASAGNANVKISTSNKITEYQISPNLKYYYKLSEVFALVGAFSTFYSHSVTPYSIEVPIFGSIQSNIYTNTVGAGIVPSLLFFPHRRWSIGVNLGSLFGIYNASKIDVQNFPTNINGVPYPGVASNTTSTTYISVLGISGNLTNSMSPPGNPFMAGITINYWLFK